ncbi:MAG: hypothetical protein V3U49_06395 [Nitrososphaerales archaeon]
MEIDQETADQKSKYWLHPLVKEFAYDDLSSKKEVHELAVQYYLSLPIPDPRRKKEDVTSLIEAFYHATKANDPDKVASIMYDHALGNDLSTWGHNREILDLLSNLLPQLL